MAKRARDAATEPAAPEDSTDGPATRKGLRVGPSPIHGTGVFATRRFEADALIERCPVLVVPAEETDAVGGSIFGDYVYEWGDGYALALGYGSLYNHDRSSSARYEMDDDVTEIHIVARRRIETGEEITINYNGDGDQQAPVWFEQD